MPSSLENMRAVVTGGASGIGRAIACELASRGARVIISDVNDAGLAETLAKLGSACSSFHCDVSDHAQVERLAAFTTETLGGCDLLFANAGVIAAGRYTKMTVAEVDWILGANVRGVWSTTSVFARMMEQQPAGGRRIHPPVQGHGLPVCTGRLRHRNELLRLPQEPAGRLP